MMDILISETRWAHKKWNKLASDIKLVFCSSKIKQIMSIDRNVQHGYTQDKEQGFKNNIQQVSA